MLDQSPTLWQTAIACAFVLAGCIGGVVLDREIAHRLRRIPMLTRWEPNRIVLQSLRGIVFVWLTLLGLRAASLAIPFTPRAANVIADALLAVTVLSVALALARMAAGFVSFYARRAGGVIASTSIFVNLARIIVITIGVMVVLQSLGISVTPALAALGVGGLAVALALQDTLSNFFAGLHIIASNQVNIGDYVRLSAEGSGYVTDINWRNTTIRSLDNNMVIVPNARLASAVVTNYGQPDGEMAVLVEVGVSYDSDLPHVEEATVDVAREVMRTVPGGVAGFEPFIRFHTFGPYGVNFTVIMRAHQYVDQYILKHEFVKRLHQRYQEEGIRIPFPISTVQIEEPLQWWRTPVGSGAGRAGNGDR